MQGFHGVSAEEHRLMNTFEVNLDVKFEEKGSDFDRLEDTISYSDLYDIVREKMQIPGFLLEKICQGIIQKTREQFPFVREIRVSVYKLRPPIEHFEGKVGVSMHREFYD
jgi:7,8-dihydroneopterin aldolase/epimerase/oxygenase